MPALPQSTSNLKLRVSAECSQSSPAISDSANQATAVSSITKHVSQSLIAVSFTISKSKPPNMSMKEYLEQLRKHIKTGKPAPRDSLQYIDTAEFWKDQFTKLHQQKKALEDENLCLKEAQRSSRKRSRGAFEQDTLHSSRNASVDLDESQSHLVENHTPSSNDDALRSSSYALRIRRHRVGLENIIADFTSLDRINAVAKQTLELLALLEDSLTSCYTPLKLFMDDDEESNVSFSFQLLTNQFILSYPICLTAVDALCKTIPGRTHKAEIIYRMVMVFKQGLDVLQSISVDQVANARTSPERSSRHKRAKRTGEYLVNKQLTRALATIAQDAQWNAEQSAHSKILEGLLFSVLEHTGRLVTEAVFGEQIATSELPGKITQNNQKVEGFVRPEARYIIQVLNATVGAGHRSDLVARMLSARVAPLNAQKGSSNLSFSGPGDMLAVTKKLLQGTLVRSALGDTDFESLKLPSPPAEMSNIDTPHAMEYGKDWLIDTVWGLIGWDIVRSR